MRLTCPNCAAQYEVDGSLIPDEGRDVQCSNCGKTWFELPPNAPVADTPAPVVAAPVADAVSGDPDEGGADEWGTADDAADDAETEASGERNEREAAPDDETHDDDESGIDAPAAAVAAVRKRREVDPRAMDILKEEAERELARRDAERAGVETQSEFDLTARQDAASPSRALRARMARLRGESEPRKPTTRLTDHETSYSAPRRELLPDIDEINSSLRPADADGEAAEAARRKEFRKGFGLMIAVAAVLIVIYVAGPAIARALPGTEPVVVAYLDAANGLRDFMDGIIR